MSSKLSESARRIWTQLSQNGAVNLDYATARRVVLANQFCLIAIILNLIYALQVWILDARGLAVFLWLILSACLAFTASLWLNGQGHHRLARWILSSVPVATLLTSAYFVGNGAGLQLYLIVIWTLLFLLFTRREIKALVLFSAIYWLGFLLIEYRFTAPGLDYPFPDGIIEQIYGLSVTGTFAAVALVVGLFFAEIHRAEKRLQQEYERSESLLLNILPASIAERLKHQHEDSNSKTSGRLIADSVPEATVLFADIVGFTPLSERLPPASLVDLLNRIFSRFDAIVQQHGLEKIKTIGDAYMLVGGLPQARPDHCQAVALAALDMREALASLNVAEQQSLQIRIGLHCGPLTAGVIGRHKFAYDIWGDTVNIASRLESHSLPGQIQVSKSVYQKLGKDFDFETRGEIELKGRGRMPTWFLLSRQADESRTAPTA